MKNAMGDDGNVRTECGGSCLEEEIGSDSDIQPWWKMPPSAPLTTASVQPSRACETTATKREAPSALWPRPPPSGRTRWTNRRHPNVGRGANRAIPEGRKIAGEEGRGYRSTPSSSRTLATTTGSPSRKTSGVNGLRQPVPNEARERVKRERRGDHSSVGSEKIMCT